MKIFFVLFPIAFFEFEIVVDSSNLNKIVLKAYMVIKLLPLGLIYFPPSYLIRKWFYFCTRLMR
jgi:ammonia channel protein AmtB